MRIPCSVSRRQLLAAGIAFGAAVGAEGQESTKSGCTLGFGTYGMRTLKTEEAIDVIAAIGFDSIEITVNQGWDADPVDLSEARPQRNFVLGSRVRG